MHDIVTIWNATQEIYTTVDWNRATSFVEFVKEVVLLGGVVVAVFLNNEKK